MTYTHTFATLEVPKDVYDLIRSRLLAAGYGHTIETGSIGEWIDLEGVALQAEPEAKEAAGL
ncbi:MAG: hypothetical protein IH986_15340 [Planctomycetes bacterium]|nr:hypothetical protein [Planctomycetota bacterium]